ncbi:MAG: HAD family hydrolase [Capnocytophaga sp.]|nr:HAD family hydrolase [Capnocytophaga sp.]
MIKLIISDIDGTLVNDRKQLSENFAAVAKLMHDRNVRFCAASGRQFQSLEQLFAHIPYEMGYVSDNGAYIRYRDEDIFENPITYEAVKPVLNACETIEGIGVAICGKKKAYLKTDNEAVYEEVLLHYPALERVTSFDGIDDVIFKITVCDEKGSRTNSYPQLAHFEDQFKVVVSGTTWLDITHKHVNKGNAIRLLQEMWGITPDETVVFGDQLNDLEMMQSARYSYAMKNAQDEVKQLANYVTEYDNNHEGVIQKIAELLS